MENSSFVTDTEIDRYLNESLSDLVDLLLAEMGHEYFLTSQNIPSVADQREYDLASDFYLLLGVEVETAANEDPFILKPYMFNERYEGDSRFPPLIGGWAENAKYRVFSTINATTGAQTHKIRFNVKPQAGHTIRIWYIPHAPILDADTDVWDGHNGWEEYAIIDAALKCLEKEQNPDTVALQLRLQRMVNRIKALAHSRDLAFPQRVQDVDAG